MGGLLTTFFSLGTPSLLPTDTGKQAQEGMKTCSTPGLPPTPARGPLGSRTSLQSHQLAIYLLCHLPSGQGVFSKGMEVIFAN